MNFLRKTANISLIALAFIILFSGCKKDDDDNNDNPTSVTDIDGNVYKTVTIGDQVWMAENLKTTTYRNGDPIANVTENTEWGNLSTGAYCYYNNDESNGDTYGALYNWYAVNDSKKIAPEGWHVATQAEWGTLISYLGEEGIAGGKMKSISDLWQSVNISATNESGFSGLPGGARTRDGVFENILRDGVFWSSTKEGDEWAMNFFLHYENSDCTSYSRDLNEGYSIRCIKD